MLKDMKKEELEILTYKELTYLVIKEDGIGTASELLKKIIKLKDLDDSVFENKIGEYYEMLNIDKNFILLDDKKWDLRENHTSDKVLKADEIEEEDEELDVEDDFDTEEIEDMEIKDINSDDEDYEEDDIEDDLSELTIVGEEEIGTI